ncbi:hypothetical protein [Microbispora amethystogenes]|uniref:hypothetical protein n=1 Tax=Microbispora amethystogenes TaxID=1427754 RepID=UPI00195481C0|nr:hypothetical protein [Microbispora amethystogenes]
MFDGLGVAIGDLAFPGSFNSTGGVPKAECGEGDTTDDDEAGGSLDQSVAGGVEGFHPLTRGHLRTLDFGEWSAFAR